MPLGIGSKMFKSPKSKQRSSTKQRHVCWKWKSARSKLILVFDVNEQF